MRRMTFALIAVALLIAGSTPLVHGLSLQAGKKPLRFVAELAGNLDARNEPLTLDVTFHGERPEPARVDEALRKCLEAAVVMHPDNDIAANAWYSASSIASDRQKLKIKGGAEGLLYVAKDRTTRSVAGGKLSADDGATGREDLSAILENPEVSSACESVPKDKLSTLVGVASEHSHRKRRFISRAMRAWCKDNDVKVDGDLRSCMSAISKAVTDIARGDKSVSADLPADMPAAIARGEKVYATGQCSKCHMDNGRGGFRGPSLVDDDWLHCDGSIAGIRAVLVSGVPRNKLKDSSRPFAMNPVTGLVPDDKDLTDLAIYVHSLSQK